MPLPWLWSFLFFLMLFLLGASTEIALVDVFCSCVYDQNKKYRNKKWLVVIVFFFYCTRLVFSTVAGLYRFEMFDEYAAELSSVCAVSAERLVMMYVMVSEMLETISLKCSEGQRTSVLKRVNHIHEKEPWDEDDASNHESRKAASWDDIATIETSSSIHQIY
ncbi:unnamed protein product [Caenorhabditis brenneri]